MPARGFLNYWVTDFYFSGTFYGVFYVLQFFNGIWNIMQNVNKVVLSDLPENDVARALIFLYFAFQFLFTNYNNELSCNSVGISTNMKGLECF